MIKEERYYKRMKWILCRASLNDFKSRHMMIFDLASLVRIEVIETSKKYLIIIIRIIEIVLKLRIRKDLYQTSKIWSSNFIQ